MNIHRIAALGVFAATGALLAACSDSTGPADGMGEVQVTFQQTNDAVVTQLAAMVTTFASDASGGPVPREYVESLTVTVTGIQLLPHCDAAGTHTGNGQCSDLWVALTLDEPVTLDLLALPTEAESPIVLAAGSIPVGEYHMVRLFIDDATVVFAETFTVGRSSFAAGTAYTVEIPSARNSGIKADIDLVVEDAGEGTGGEVGLLFDPDATFRHVVATGNGRVLMPPVIKARGLHRNQTAQA